VVAATDAVNFQCVGAIPSMTWALVALVTLPGTQAVYDFASSIEYSTVIVAPAPGTTATV
jgi:hypothetical protein